MKQQSLSTSSLTLSTPTSPTSPLSPSRKKYSTSPLASPISPSSSSPLMQTALYNNHVHTILNTPTNANQTVESLLMRLIEDVVIQYTINFEACLTDELAILPAFRQFLIFEHNLSSLDFIIAYDDFVNEKGSRYHKASGIIKRFLEDMSSDQLNLTDNVRNDVINRFEKYDENSDIDIDLFDNCRRIVHMELRNDNFSRFLSSSFFTGCLFSLVSKEITIPMTNKSNQLSQDYVQEFMKTLDNNLIYFGERRQSNAQQSSNSPANSSRSGNLSDSEVDTESTASDMSTKHKKVEMKEALTNLLLEKDSKIITDQYYNLFKTLSEMDIWKEIYDSKNVTSYISKEKLVSKGKLKSKSKGGLSIVKEVCIVDDLPEEILYAFIDSRLTKFSEPNVTHTKFIEFIEESTTFDSLGNQIKTYPISCSSTVVKTPWPLDDREIYACTSVRREPNQVTNQMTNYSVLRKSYEPSTPVKKGCIRGYFFGAIFIEQLNEKQTKMTTISFIDIGGKVPSGVWNKIIKMRGPQVSLNLEKALKARRQMSQIEREVTSEHSLKKLDTLH
ncbi:predicted protein [Naegleria gruberi]|uniref:Predicted protein n=1 Tax=Naegleria gruberi TaxID=5762 RepID=D2VHA1_NAEGR|nr:uncharacterized protein NAEGRDRAFT_68141 [Naegleria gruberi]EFC43853.1 predicted protein [Naegleria gruberi]|eukprot:XP_002676597.1 predicted protein [Naegleria gruberi strain NEG-M]